MQTIKTIGLDIAKSVFQVHGIDAAGQVAQAEQVAGVHVFSSQEGQKPSPATGYFFFGAHPRVGNGRFQALTRDAKTKPRSLKLQVLTKPDADGRLLGMIKTFFGYARESGTLSQRRIDAMLKTVERSLAEGTYLAITPQFLVTATR